jgi:hypothetical protein
MTTDELLDYILTIIETYDPLNEEPIEAEEWQEADPLEKEVSLVIRALWNELEIDVNNMLGNHITMH